ncbi:MAG: PH domain-containing protein [Patescibacteria group bacterium]|nr:PH domain-containing protein [Patescibacteria group bacterium]
MKEALFVQLDTDEEVLGIVRRSLVFKWWKWLIVLCWLLLPFFFFYPLIKLGAVGFIIFIALIISAVWNTVRCRFEWVYTMFLITDRRIIDVDQHGIFNRSISELGLDDISEVVVRQSTLQKIIGLGTILVHTNKKNHFDLELTGVHDPEHVRDLIVDVQYITGDYVDQAKSKKSK